MLQRIAQFKLALICCLFLAVAACSKKATNNLDAGMGAAPGSEQGESQEPSGDDLQKQFGK